MCEVGKKEGRPYTQPLPEKYAWFITTSNSIQNELIETSMLMLNLTQCHYLMNLLRELNFYSIF